VSAATLKVCQSPALGEHGLASHPCRRFRRVPNLRDSVADLTRRVRAGATWWRRRGWNERLLILAGIVLLTAAASSAVRDALVALVLAVTIIAVLGLVLAGAVVGGFRRIARRHPLADFAAGYLLGRHHGRRRTDR
jgi:hypothetical protein